MKEDKIEVGEYVRTEYDGIKRCVHINEEEVTNMYWLAGKMVEDIQKKVKIYYSNDYKKIDIDEVIKHSKNIIDLIEVEDYVNGQRVYALSTVTGWIETKESIIYKNDIKSIVTKEQFKSIEYRLEE